MITVLQKLAVLQYESIDKPTHMLIQHKEPFDNLLAHAPALVVAYCDVVCLQCTQRDEATRLGLLEVLEVPRRHWPTE